MQTFDLEEEDISSNNILMKERINSNSNSKYAASTFTKGFFNQEEELFNPSNINQLDYTPSPHRDKEEKESSRKRRTKKGATK